MKTDIVQKAVVFNAVGKMLALRRSKTDVRRPLQWDLPGGLLDPGESFVEGVTREIKEETGVEINEPKLVFSKTQVREWLEAAGVTHTNNCVFLFYVARAKTDQVSLSYEHSEYKWFTLEEALDEFEYPLHKELIEHVKKHKLAG